MASMFRLARTLLVVFLLVPPLTACSSARPSAPQTPAAGPVPPLAAHELRDRVVAVVDEEAVLLSEIEAIIALGLAAGGASRADVLDGLIDQRLRFQAADRFGLVQVSVERIEEQVSEIAERFESRRVFAERLAEVGLTEAEMRQLVARQLMVLNYVDQQLGARVFVSLDDIRAYYDGELVPALERRGEAVPPLEEVREEVRAVLKERRLNEEIERWSAELRREADVQIFLDDEIDDLPPLVWGTAGEG